MKIGNQSKKRGRNKSAPHKAAISFLLTVFPGTTIQEEVTVEGPNGPLYLDLYLPKIPLIVEVHGEQHYKHIPFFHKTLGQFLLAQKRDRDKIEWANSNEIPIVIFPSDKQETWHNLLTLAISPDSTT